MAGAPAKRPSAELSLRVYERPLYQLKGRCGPLGLQAKEACSCSRITWPPYGQRAHDGHAFCWQWGCCRHVQREPVPESSAS